MKKIIGKDAVKEHAEVLLAKMENVGALIIKTANKTIEDSSKTPPPKDLYHGLIYERELTMLFADTGVGKTIKATQISETIARDGLTTLIACFELSPKQFEQRYSQDFTNPYEFSENLYRAEINPDGVDFNEAGYNSMEDFLINSLIGAVKEIGATVLVIDNVTWLSQETEKAKYALPFVKKMKAIGRELKITIIILAHTPKRDLTKPISVNDLAGSKMLINFCDSAFAIGLSSQDKSLRYIKQVKCRATEIKYDAENVAVYRIVKPANFLHFEFVGFSTEREHLKELTEREKQERIEKAKEMRKNGFSLQKIGDEFGVNRMNVHRMLKPITDVTNVTSVTAS